MSYTNGLRYFKERPVHVACPVCAHRADQKAGKLRKDTVLECPMLVYRRLISFCHLTSVM
ncbi:TPA: YnfU family zinc-binding protein [Klebsiella aerogenes]